MKNRKFLFFVIYSFVIISIGSNGYSQQREFKGLKGQIPLIIDKKTGEPKIEPQFDFAHDFSEGLAGVYFNYDFFYINKYGAIEIPKAYFIDLWPFSEGLAFVGMGGVTDRWGFINKNGEMVIQMNLDLYIPKGKSLTSARKWQYLVLTPSGEMALIEGLYTFFEGLALIRTNGYFGFIDKTGNIAISPKFEQAGIFSEGLAPVWFDNKWGYIDKTGNTVIPFEFDHARGFSEGLALVKFNNKWGYIDKTGNTVIDFKYLLSGVFSEGLAYVEIGKKYGYIDKTGKIVINPQFIEANNFSEGLAIVKIGKKYGYIDKTGKIVISPQFVEANNFSEGLAGVKIGKKYGYIDKTGKIVINPQFANASNFSEGLARVHFGKRYGYIDKLGRYLWDPKNLKIKEDE